MADRRRRRRIKSSEDSDELSEGSGEEQEIEKASEAESVDEPRETVVADSEYESAEEEGDGERTKAVVTKDEASTEPAPVVEVEPEVEQLELQNGIVDEPQPELIDEEGGVEDIAEETVIDGDYVDGELDDEDDEEDDDEDEEGGDEDDESQLENGNWKDVERQQGDGQESQSQKEKVLDDDEDKRNPQYIPKKGGFYEHDDRLFDDEEKEEEKKPKKKLWKDEGKWSHDRFKEEDQRPKSRDELVTAYGYDIRNEDGPPRARRRRRYGRGPNKYTRKWEDEEAYAKMGLPRRSGTEVIRPRGRGRGFPRGRGFVSRGNFRGRGTNMRGGDHPRIPPWQRYHENPVCSQNYDDSRHFEKSDLRTPKATNTNVNVSQEPCNVSSPVTTAASVSEEAVGSLNGTQSSQTDSESSEQLDEIISETTLVATNKNIKPFAKNGFQMNSRDNVTEKQTQTEPKPRGGMHGQGRSRGGMPNRGMGDRRTYQSSMRNRQGMDPGSNNSGGMVKSFEKLSLKDSKDCKHSREPCKDGKSVPSHHAPQDRRQSAIPPRLQEGAAASANRPKRYSSQRQRNVPDSSFQASPPIQSQGQMPPRFYDHGIEYQSVPEGGQSSANSIQSY